ncbi:hypothetical protein GQR58_025050 [Nymphon striatum]|nr:hypothetical protein GQR58_025050 [Nymphon striatum]
MKEKAKEEGYIFPYLYDETQEVAKAYDAACTPDFYLFDSELNLAYRGQLDDSRPGNGIPSFCVMKIDSQEALDKLADLQFPFVNLFNHGSLSVEVYKPNKVDLQQPHTKDEVYIIISGSGEFLNDGKRTTFKVGDFLFVPAGIEHRFENFTEDFSTWVLFYGPEGGEKDSNS